MEKEILLVTTLTDISAEVVGYTTMKEISREPKMSLTWIQGEQKGSLKPYEIIDITDKLIISKAGKSFVKLLVELE